MQRIWKGANASRSTATGFCASREMTHLPSWLRSEHRALAVSRWRRISSRLLSVFRKRGRWRSPQRAIKKRRLAAGTVTCACRIIRRRPRAAAPKARRPVTHRAGRPKPTPQPLENSWPAAWLAPFPIRPKIFCSISLYGRDLCKLAHHIEFGQRERPFAEHLLAEEAQDSGGFALGRQQALCGIEAGATPGRSSRIRQLPYSPRRPGWCTLE
jgi:hypothetical protein